MNLIEEFGKLVERLQKEKIPFALCGGLAMAVYAFPRATLDIDLMIEPEALPAVKRLSAELGYTLDSGLMSFKGGTIQIHRLAKAVPEHPDIMALDLLLVTPEVRSIWDSRRNETWEQGILPVVSPEGLIQLKTLRGSGQDHDDIKHLRRLIDES